MDDEIFPINGDQVHKLAKAFARNECDLDDLHWLWEGTNLGIVRSLRRNQFEPLVLKPSLDAQRHIVLDRTKVGRGRELVIAPRGWFQPDPHYRVEVDSSQNFDDFVQWERSSAAPEELNAEMFPYSEEENGTKDFALIEFTYPGHSGVCGPSDAFVLEKFQKLGLRPATFIELISFGRHIRRIHCGEHNGVMIIALGSVVTSVQVTEKENRFRGFLRKLRPHSFPPLKINKANYYPYLRSGGGEPIDAVSMTSCDHAPWPLAYIFLGVHL